MKKAMLSTAGAAALLAFAFSGTAQAQSQCWWTGYGYSCAPPAMYYAQPYWGLPYPALRSYPGSGEVPYGDNPYKPDWLPSYPGPKPSSGAGR